ncbi:hypothetical protein GCM10012320_07640 [Sinomonas cellulolyticus]|nr:ABC transporter permease [Sinomonas sp. KCTC 49339]GHG43425.1 hypothetical protein GCM10012320_07640 [Sinomonas sp. KCTC 49339]
MSPPRPGRARLLADQLVYAVRDLWRTRIAFIFTFLFPLTILLAVGAMTGNAQVAPGSDVRIMQFVTPSAGVMGALYGAYPTVASSLADAREKGVLKRLRGTPLPGWIYLAGRIGAAALMAVGSLALMLAVGVLAYGVHIQWHTMPATVVTVLVAVISFAALGVAVAGLARSAMVAQAVSIATAVALSFVSGVMGYGDMPDWADRIAAVFPLKPFSDAVAEQFDPFSTADGWDLPALGLMAAWAVGAGGVAALAFRWEPARGQRVRRSRHVPSDEHRVEGVGPAARRRQAGLRAAVPGRPSWLSLLKAQTGWATRSALRDPGWVFFAIAMPVGLYMLNVAMMGEALDSSTFRPPLVLQNAAGLTAWGAAVNVMVNLPDDVARARDRGILKRLRGAPLQIGFYFAGRFVSGLLLALVTGILIVAAGLAWFGLDLSWSGVPLALGLLVLGTASLAACGLLLVAVLPNSKATLAVGLGLALPLSFFSDIFVFGALPDWMSTVGSFFPLKHLANGLSAALDPSGMSVNGVGIAVMGAWLLGATVLATKLFRWSPR